MGFYRFFHNASTRVLIGFFLIASLFASPAYSLDTRDSQLFITGFNAYLKKDYKLAIDNLSESLQKYPESSLRDMTILWLSRSYLNTGNKKDAGRYMALFLREYPDNPLKSTVEEELLELAAKSPPVDVSPGQQVAKSPGVATAVVSPVVADPKIETVAQINPRTGQDEAVRLADEKLARESAGHEPNSAAADAKQKEQSILQSKLLSEQAIAEYKAVLDRYPGTQAATSANKRLKELGVDYQAAANATTSSLENDSYSQAVSSYKNGKYKESLILFTRYIEMYPLSTLAADALLYRAESLLKLSGQ